jgi:hypothetical protein
MKKEPTIRHVRKKNESLAKMPFWTEKIVGGTPRLPTYARRAMDVFLARPAQN